MNVQNNYSEQKTVVPFAAHFGENLPSEDSFVDKDGTLLFDMSNPTHLGDEGDESC